MLTVGDKLPEFKLQACVGLEKGKEFKELSSVDFAGKWKVLFFWPMDFTFICPTEIAEFGRLDAQFKERGAVVMGASTDSHYVHHAWRTHHADLKSLPFPMLADAKRELSSALGILEKDAGVCLRATFIIDEKDVIQSVSVNGLSAGRNVEETLRTLDALQNGGLCPVNWKRGDSTL